MVNPTEISEEIWGELQRSIIINDRFILHDKSIGYNLLISRQFINQYNWGTIFLDDGDFELEPFEDALTQIELDKYYIVTTSELSKPLEKRTVFCFDVGAESVAPFYTVYDDGYAPFLEDSLFFSLPLKFLILRPGHTDYGVFTGPLNFLETMTGIKVPNKQPVAVGSHYSYKKPLEYYKIEKILS